MDGEVVRELSLAETIETSKWSMDRKRTSSSPTYRLKSSSKILNKSSGILRSNSRALGSERNPKPTYSLSSQSTIPKA